MRKTAFAAAISVTGIFWLLQGSNSGRLSAVQPPKEKTPVHPKVLAYLKPVEIAAGDNELQRKLKERHNVAVKLLEERVNEHKAGVRDVGPVFEAARLTAEAKLDLADTPQARIAVLQQVLDIAGLIESHLRQQLDKGFGSRGDLERARYARISVEVELIKARQKPK